MAFSPGTWQAVITATILLAWAAAATGRGIDMGDMLMMDRFLMWQATHNPSYPSAEERLRRFQVYRHNVEYIDATNRRGDLTYQLGENQFTDLTREEFLARFTSYNGDDLTDDDDDSVITTTAVGGGDDVSLDPPSVDWRAKGAVVPPKNQSSSCCTQQLGVRGGGDDREPARDQDGEAGGPLGAAASGLRPVRRRLQPRHLPQGLPLGAPERRPRHGGGVPVHGGAGDLRQRQVLPPRRRHRQPRLGPGLQRARHEARRRHAARCRGHRARQRHAVLQERHLLGPLRDAAGARRHGRRLRRRRIHG